MPKPLANALSDATPGTRFRISVLSLAFGLEFAGGSVEQVRTTHRNWVLQSMDDHSYSELHPHLRKVEIALGEVMFEPSQQLMHGYFIEQGIGSMSTTMRDGSSAEIGLFSHDGIVGIQGIIGAPAIPARCMAQTPVEAFRAPTTELVKVFQQNASFQRIVLLCLHLQIVQLAQIAACNRVHSIEERLARWLLMVQDRLETEVLPLTHEFLAMMLGSTRSSVTITAGILARSGLIEYHRGIVRILNRAALEEAACECYGVIREYLMQLRPSVR